MRRRHFPVQLLPLLVAFSAKRVLLHLFHFPLRLGERDSQTPSIVIRLFPSKEGRILETAAWSLRDSLRELPVAK